MAYALKLHIPVLFDASTFRGQLAAISHVHAYMKTTVKETKHDVCPKLHIQVLFHTSTI